MNSAPMGSARGLPVPALGDAVNLLHGVAWSPRAGGMALACPPRQPLQRFALDTGGAAPGRWGAPRVTLHHDAISLAARLFVQRVQPFRFDGPEFAIAPMLLWDEAVPPAPLVRQLETLLCVTLREGCSYLLFERRRHDARDEHEVVRAPARRHFDRERHLTPEWRRAGSRLRPGRPLHDGNQQDARIGAAMAHAYVDGFYDYGTHFVSAVEVGDLMFQVAVLRPESCSETWRYWKEAGGGGPVEGQGALPFQLFAETPYALETGPVVSLAGDPALPPLLALGGNPTARLLGGTAPFAHCEGAFRAATAIDVELTSLGRFMEFHRGVNFERVLRGALLQRWGKRVSTTLRRLPGVERALAATVLPGGGLSPNTDDRLAAFPDTAEATVCCRILNLRRGARYMAGPGLVLAQFVDAAQCCQRAPTICLPDERFEHGGLGCETMAGALLLEDASGTRRDAVVDGLRFTDGGKDADGQPRVRIRGDMSALPLLPDATLLPCVHAALQRSACALFLPETPNLYPRAAAAAFAGWLGALLASIDDAPSVPPVRAWAAYLARLEGWLPPPPPREGPAGGDGKACLAALASTAIEAGERLRGYTAGTRPPADAGRAAWEHAAATCDAMDALDRKISRLYLALLDADLPRCEAALEQARARHANAATRLAHAAATLYAQLARQRLRPPGRLILRMMGAAAAGDAPPPAAAPDSERGHAAATALAFAACQARLHRHATQLDAVGRLAGTLAVTAAGFAAAARALAAIELEHAPLRTGPDWSSVRNAVMDGLDAGTSFDAALAATGSAWSDFQAARPNLLAAHAQCCRLALETWQHAHLMPALRRVSEAGPQGGETAHHGIVMARLRILTTLGQALRREPSADALPAGELEPDAIGYMLAVQQHPGGDPPG